jgi:hypothetical protein
MPSKIILCRDCEAETTTIEQTGNWKVTSCAPAPGEANKPAATDQKEANLPPQAGAHESPKRQKQERLSRSLRGTVRTRAITAPFCR